MSKYIKLKDVEELQGNDRFKNDILLFVAQDKIPVYELEDLE